jgi:hypothetical protein
MDSIRFFLSKNTFQLIVYHGIYIQRDDFGLTSLITFNETPTYNHQLII